MKKSFPCWAEFLYFYHSFSFFLGSPLLDKCPVVGTIYIIITVSLSLFFPSRALLYKFVFGPMLVQHFHLIPPALLQRVVHSASFEDRLEYQEDV